MAIIDQALWSHEMWPLKAHAGLMGIYPVYICKLLLIGSRHRDFCLALVVQSSGFISVQLCFKQ